MNIKKKLPMLILCVVPVIAMASGGHAGHDSKGYQMMQGHDMEGMQNEMHEDDHDSMAGMPGDPEHVNRTIEVDMKDSMRFSPSSINVKAGETVRFFIKNTGKMKHEMVIGSMDELKEHAEMMRKMPGMKHVEPNMITLAPGQRGGLIWQFDKTGTVDFACLVPGHMEAGMTGEITVK